MGIKCLLMRVHSVYIGHFFASLTNVYHDRPGNSHVHTSSISAFQSISRIFGIRRNSRRYETKSGLTRNWIVTQRTIMVEHSTANFTHIKCGFSGHAHSITAFKPQITSFTGKIHLYGYSNAFDFRSEPFYFDTLLASFTLCVLNHWSNTQVKFLIL